MRHSRGRKYFVINHQLKAVAYMNALAKRGWRPTSLEYEAEFALLDLDVLSRSRKINEFHEKGKPSFLYPHTGRPPLQWDGMYKPNPHVTAVFGIGEGWVEIPKIYGYNAAPIYPMGWTYCEIKEFQPCEKPKNILFAPIHVNGNGYLSQRERNTNAEVYRRLLALKGINLTVRFLYALQDNGLWKVDGVNYVSGIADQTTAEIDAADVVVSHQLMGYLSVARGKPTLFMDEGLVPISGNTDAALKTVASWDKYKHLLMFPHDILAGDDTMALIESACVDSEGIKDWKRRLIGDPFDGEKFADKLESLL